MNALKEVVRKQNEKYGAPAFLPGVLLAVINKLSGRAGDVVIPVSKQETINEAQTKINNLTGK